MSERVDPVTLTVIQSRLESIAVNEEKTLIKSSYSPIVKDMSDATAAVFDAKGRAIAQPIAHPIHLGTLMLSVPTIIREFPIAEAQEGDVYIHNDPYDGGTHLPDISMVEPVLYDGEVVALAASMVHHSDIGGIKPGVSTTATSLYQEGLCLPAVKFYDAGKPVKAIHDIIRKNVRVPEQVLGDLEAQVAAGHVGKVRLLELFDEYGKEVVLGAMEQLMDHSEALTRRALEAIPDGTYCFTDYMDNDGVDLDQRIKLQVAITIKGSDVIADFSGSSSQTRGPLNCSPATTYAIIAYALKIIGGGGAIPTNDGCFRMIKTILPEGSIVNPIHPGASGTRTTSATALYSTVQGALVKAKPEMINACSGAFGPILYLGGRDPLTGTEYINNELAPCGLGARPMKDGIDVIFSDLDDSTTIPVEALETDTPFRVLECGLHDDSGGAGEYRGGLGWKKSLKLLRGTASVTFRGERCYVPAWGLFGGLPAGVTKGSIMRKSGEVVDIPSKGDYILNEGDVVSIASSGGGGYGDPLKRKPELVLRDVLDERVSLKAAADNYGVVIDEESMTINSEKTIELRKEKARLRGPITWTYDQGPWGRH